MAFQFSFYGLSIVLPINPPLEIAYVATCRDNWLIYISKFLIDASVFLLMVSWIFSISLWVFIIYSRDFPTCSKRVWVTFMNWAKAFSSWDGFPCFCAWGTWGAWEVSWLLLQLTFELSCQPAPICVRIRVTYLQFLRITHLFRISLWNTVATSMSLLIKITSKRLNLTNIFLNKGCCS